MFDLPSGTFRLKAWDANQLGLLPPGWVGQVTGVVERYAEACILDGTSSTSRELEPNVYIELCIVTGDKVRDYLPWLFAAYAGPFRSLAQELCNKELDIATDSKSGININVISGLGGRYERHVDSNPVTAILYASTLLEADGGGLVFDHLAGSDVIYPRSGLFIVFDALNTPHYVAPLKRLTVRLSVTMNYYFKGQPQIRPIDLDHYLYKSTVGDAPRP